MQQPEVRALAVLAVQRIFVMFAQVTQVIGVVEIIELRGIAAEFLVVVSDCPRVLHSAVDHFRFLLPLKLMLHRDNNSKHHADGHQGDHEKQREQDVSLSRGRDLAAFGSRCTDSRICAAHFFTTGSPGLVASSAADR